MLRTAKLASVLMVAGLALISCAHSAPVLVGPAPCEAMTEAQLSELEYLIEDGSLPGIVEVISAYEQHCREDDALMDREID